MADRDLMNKPLPLAVPEERDREKKGLVAPSLGKLGVQTRARDVGEESDAPALRGPAGAEPAPVPGSGKAKRAPAQRSPSAAPARAPAEAPKAFRAAYFNQDVGSTAAPNLRARPMAALRGEGAATDLKKVVLPPPAIAGIPEPQQLAQALGRMEPASGAALDLPGLLARHGAWTQSEGMTAEKIMARMAELEEAVALRQEALARMVQLTPEHVGRSRTLTQAVLADGEALEGDDLAEAGDDLVRNSSDAAEPLLGRLRKVLGSRR